MIVVLTILFQERLFSMSFEKIGSVFKMTNCYELNGYEQWDEFKKQASKNSTVIPIEKSLDEKKADEIKESDLEIVATIDTNNFIYIHSTIMAGVNTEPNKYWITEETQKFANDNNDGWTCEDLLKDYKSFKRATTFVEHVQMLEKARGRCIDVIARKMSDTVLIDVLFSVSKKHTDLVDNIKTGIINAVSMGCSTEKTICSVCGNEAKDPKQYCQHIKSQKGQMIKCSDGKLRKAVELCKNNHFFDISLVANPAFAGAIFRKILSSEQVGTQLLANILCDKIESFERCGNTILKAASSEIEINKNGQVKIKSGEEEIKSEEIISKEELNNINAVLRNEHSATKFLKKIIGRFFTKGDHPILNSTSDDDFSISYKDYSPIPDSQPQTKIRTETEKQIELRLEKSVEEGIEKVSRLEQFECYNCGYKDELWQVKAFSVDNGFENVLTCPKCAFVMEKSGFKRKENIDFKVSIIDKLQLKDLGYGKKEIDKFSSEQLLLILKNNIKRSIIDHNILRSLKDNDYGKLEETLQSLEKGQELIANQDIPVDNDEGVLHFDEHGASVVTKDEKLSFVGYVEDKEYGLFRTSTGEEFFMPMSTKKNNS